ncbi:MAG TPA: DUF3806 domain-containing protein [Dermatophilaceae bacterium]|jgi:hypothetical protein|uniref:DUF3806 domain-containing protein n=1 Tax=Candidatus Phosphoribacter hodrii TaxID=2953743 RepID=A0A934X500_9MICO|nr:DUF3806 domain-containing protein [Candidatus Phosphoribacter hodrii]MBP8837433.1 DUF3806 domain-containing protein [Dermatophilaceae bacterium]HNV13388.1 DUF3806 domain-containing protein [Dermatophilaceae bacterium]HOA03842.1 DUF3806 domain-containing protein [Dermatophilaceae bacterium]HOA59122.1 DUF3806 domain-containing protein [Dermatophilaceae bacterium]
MGLFSRRKDDPSEDVAPLDGVGEGELIDAEADDDWSRPLGPRELPLRADHRALLDGCLAELEAAGIDLDDIAAIGAGYDAECAAWGARGGLRSAKAGDQDPVIARWGVAIGEHLARTTDLRWVTVEDPFGTDLGLFAESDYFALVPTNLVSGRFLNGEIGWVPGVVGHLVELRNR